MARWWPTGLVILGIGWGGTVSGLEGGKALEEFDLSATRETETLEPIDVRMDAVVPEGIPDGLLGLGFLAVLWVVGFLVCRVIPGFRHYLAPALGAAILFVFLRPTAFFQFLGVRVASEGVTVETQTGGQHTIAFEEVRRLFVTKRPVYRRFRDARQLVLEDGRGRRVGIPFFVPRRAEMARAIAAGLRARAGEEVLR